MGCARSEALPGGVSVQNGYENGGINSEHSCRARGEEDGHWSVLAPVPLRPIGSQKPTIPLRKVMAGYQVPHEQCLFPFHSSFILFVCPSLR